MTGTLTPVARTRPPLALCHPFVPGGDGPPAVRLGTAFLVEARETGSRLARLAILGAYEHAGGDEWCLRVDVVDSAGSSLRPVQVTKGLLELERAIARSVHALPVDVDAAFEIRPEPTADRRGSRSSRHPVALSPTSTNPDSPGTAPSSILALNSQPKRAFITR